MTKNKDSKIQTSTEPKACKNKNPSNIIIPEENKRLASEMGLEFPAIDLDYLSAPDIEVADIRAASKVAIVHSTIRKLEKLIFEGSEIQVSPPDDVEVSDEEISDVQSKVEECDKIIRTNLRMRQAWFDKVHYGSAIFEKIPGKAGDWKAYQVFKRLPAFSFEEKPSERSDTARYVFGYLLEGILYDTTISEYEYWQKQTASSMPIQLDNANILHIRKETSDSPDGDSLIIPVLPLIKKLAFIEKAAMQSVNRAGAPNLDVIVKEFREEPISANPDAWNFAKRFTEAKKIAKNHGKDTCIPHPDSIELHGIDYKNNLEIKKYIEFYEQRILNALIPKDFTDAQKAGNLASNSANLDILILYAKGEQHEIEEPFLKLWNEILVANGREGWKVEIVWRELTPVSDTEKFAQLDIAVKAGIFTEDELREMVGFAPKAIDESVPEEPTVTPETPKQVPDQSPYEEIPTSEEIVAEQNADTSLELEVADLLKMKSEDFIKYCRDQKLIPWEKSYEA